MLAPTNGALRVDQTAMYDEPTTLARLVGAVEPESIEEIGIDFERLTDLALKTFFVLGQLSCRELAERMALPVYLAQEILDHVRRAKLVDTVVGRGHNEPVQRYTLTSNGSEQAHGLLQRNRYVGPTPVPLETYCDVIRRNAQRSSHVGFAELQEALSGLVLSPDIVNQLGPAVDAGRSLFIYGSSGNGKTSLAEAIGDARGSETLVPYAIEAKGEIIRVFDAAIHKTVDDAAGSSAVDGFDPAHLVARARHRDRRWARVRRPLLVAGGELTLDQLELSYSAQSGIHQAPYQLKANSGTFLIDDFGRQRVRPADLLNRWIVPLEKNYDYLRLATGDVVEIPFDILVIFSTNLSPRDLVDDAFMRRIKYTLELLDPTPSQYREIFRRFCDRVNVEYQSEVVDDVIERYYHEAGRPMRSCHPRDIIERICDRAKYEERPPALDREVVEWACDSYFQLHG